MRPWLFSSLLLSAFLVFSLQTFPPLWSLWCTHSWSCPFLSLLMKIATSSTMPPPYPPPVSSLYNIAGLTATLYTFPFTLPGTLLSQITHDILLHPFHPACTLFHTLHYFEQLSPGNWNHPLSPPLLAFSLLSKAYLQLSSFASTCSLLSLQITMSSANIMVHGASSLISSVILSVTIANKQGLKAYPWCSPTFTWNHPPPPALLQHTSPVLYSHHTYISILL